MVRSALIVVSVLLAAANLSAQSQSGPGQSPSIEGEVHWPNGRPATHIYLRLVAESSGMLFETASTDSAGFYMFRNVGVGRNYFIRVDVDGYKPIRRLVMVTAYMTEEDIALEPVPGVKLPDNRAVVSVEQLQVPESARSQFRKGVRRLREGKTVEAEQAFQKAIRIYPKFAASYMRLGALYADQGRFPEADEAIEKALAIHKNSSSGYAYLGYIYMQEKHAALAEQAFHHSIGISSRNWFAQLELGRLLYQQKDYQTAYPYLVAAHELHPQLRPIHLLLYNDLIRLNRRKRALTEVDEFLARFPKAPEAAKLRKVREALAAAVARQH
jgi:tetratricopeptide (TPR) repeat protein